MTKVQAGVNFIAGPTPSAASGTATLLYNIGSGALAWDSDGTGAAAAVQFAVVFGSLRASDILFA
jgi:hypothetical protein